MISLKKLFRFGSPSRDELSQGQREAIVDLLNYVAFADHDISRAEEIAIEDLEFQLDWDHATDFDYYVNKSIGIVRGVIESKESELDFLEQIRSRLDSKKSRATALALCEKLVRSDAHVTSDEGETLAEIKRILA